MAEYSDKETELFIEELQKSSSNGISIKDVAYMCLAKWYWFVISLAVCMGAVVWYLLTTPPVYTRSASLLIKEESKGNSMTDAAGVLGNIDIFQSNTNVNNEMQALNSPSVMYDVVKRLHLDLVYSADGSFYREVLYGQTCPYTVDLIDIADNASFNFTIHAAEDGKTLQLFDFEQNSEKLDDNITATFDKPVTTPIGKIIVRRNPEFKAVFRDPVYVFRGGIQATARSYSGRLTVELNDEKSTVVNLSFQDVCIQRAEDVLNTLVAVYNENWVKDKNQIAVSTSMFINDRLNVIEQELGHVDENISSFKSQNLLPDLQGAASMYMQQNSETSSQIMLLNTQLSMARYVRNYLTSGTDQNQLIPANTGIENSGIESTIGEYNTKLLQRNSLVANSSENNPLVVDMDQQLQEMRRAIVTSIDNHIVTLNKQLQSFQQKERHTTAQIAANPTQGQYLLSVERQQKVKEALYLFLLQKREENELSQAFTAYNTRVIMPPTGSMAPTSPTRTKNLIIAFVIGLLLPIIIIVVRESLNTKLRGRKDLDKLTLPFAGEIPLAFDKKKLKKAPATQTVVIKQGSRNIINEAFRVLRTNLEFMIDTSADGRASAIVFTSFNPGSGKSFLALNTAACFALKGKSVLVIDADLRRASLSHYIGSPKKGLSNYLGKQEDDAKSLVVEMEEFPGLSIMPVGTIPPNPTELLAEKRFGELIESMRSEYDYIFIDCPPIDIVADTQIIEKQADRTLFIVRAGLLDRDMLPELQRAYDEKVYKNMALILNGTESGEGRRYGYRYGYKYGYHYGYSYGKSYYHDKA